MYIVLEGIDGSGKSTQSELLGNYLLKNGFKVKTIREPTNNKIGKLIREILTQKDSTTPMMQKTLGLLFAADRMHLSQEIEKLEKEDTIIISDRSFYSSLVYQEPENWIKELNKFVKIPDMVLLLDIDVEKSVTRTEGIDEFENIEFLTEVRKKYLKLAENNNNFKIIDANKGINLISKDIQKEIAPLLGICRSGIF